MKSFEELSLGTLEQMLQQVQAEELRCAVAVDQPGACTSNYRDRKDFVSGRDRSGETLLILCRECGKCFEGRTGLQVFPIIRTESRLKRAIQAVKEKEAWAIKVAKEKEAQREEQKARLLKRYKVIDRLAGSAPTSDNTLQEGKNIIALHGAGK